MDKVKATINEFTSRSGQHDTTVHETVAPGVKHEVVKPHQHEEVHTAVDKEVHQDHFHRTVQPIKDREVLPEKHETKLGAVQHREFDHRDADATKRALLEEQSKFRDQRRVDETTYSQSTAPAVGGEHVHHHIHETVQPVIQKEVIQPTVLHTTVQVHESHYNKDTHHGTTALPAMTMSEFHSKGGVLGGREERHDGFEGEPKHIGSHGIGSHEHGHEHGHQHGDRSTHIPGTTGGNSTGLSDSHSHSNTGLNKGSSHTSNNGKPSLMDKLNPNVDSTGDGKAGFMK